MNDFCFWVATPRLVSLNPVDLVIIAVYFVFVIGIGLYLPPLHHDRRRFLPGRTRHDGLGCRTQLPRR